MSCLFRWAAGPSLWALCCQVLFSAPEAADSFETRSAQYARSVRPLLVEYCVECHSGESAEGELDLERFESFASVRQVPHDWERIAEKLHSGEMPPADARQPTDDERRRLRDWIEAYLDWESQSLAGEPGPVVLRRLTNAEFTYSIQDLTGVALTPAAEFPVDSAAGEGFTNAGAALVMSPAMLEKYLGAAKMIAGHAVLLPSGMRFSLSDSRRDWTDEIVREIRGIYSRFADTEGRVPLSEYVAASIEEREANGRSTPVLEEIADRRGLSARYLQVIFRRLNSGEPSPLFDAIRLRWRNAKPADSEPAESEPVAAYIADWQAALWRFQNVGHMKPWMVPVVPLVASQELRLKVPEPVAGGNGGGTAGGTVTLYLVTGSAGDGDADDIMVWQQPRLAIPGGRSLLLRDVRAVAGRLAARREQFVASTAECLAAVAEAMEAPRAVELGTLAERHAVDREMLADWLDYLGVGRTEDRPLDHMHEKITSAAGFGFVQGWGKQDTPNLFTNSSDRHVRIPGNLRPHSVAMHPSPTLRVAVGWRSPLSGAVRVEGTVIHAHPECGNGIEWSLEVQRFGTRRQLAVGKSARGEPVAVGPLDALAVGPGDLISLCVSPRGGDHACDLTDVELVIRESGGEHREWDLARDVSSDPLAGNPHADGLGNEGVWHFFTEPLNGAESVSALPSDSILARWLAVGRGEKQRELAELLERLLAAGPEAGADHPDTLLYRQLTSIGGPLLAGMQFGPEAMGAKAMPEPASAAAPALDSNESTPWGLDPAEFGRHPDGMEGVDETSLCVRAPSVVELRLPAELVAGSELITSAIPWEETGPQASMQCSIATDRPKAPVELQAVLPVIARPESTAWRRFEQSFDEFRQLFPAAFCYSRVVPVDEVITLTLFHREDEPLCRLMLDDEDRARLDRLWSELRFVSQDALATVDAFEQLLEYASQDNDPSLFEPLRGTIDERAESLRRWLVESEPQQLDTLLAFAARAYRRPLLGNDAEELRGLYHRLRGLELPHDEAFRLTLARVLVSPEFLYRVEGAAADGAARPLSDYELAGRLSYFLWSSLPDEALWDAAANSRLSDPDVLATEARRMLRDDRVRRLAEEFACQWLQIYDFDSHDEKSERHFPEFASVRGEMYEESIRFFTDLFQSDAPVMELWNADHTFANAELAEFLGMPGVSGADWQRIDGVRQYGRGGVLGLTAILAKQSGASRTSPVLRGNWVSEVLLGEKLPRPPKDVPQLPEDEAGAEGLSVRQLVEKHAGDPRCAVCHVRIDPFGFALEGFDAIGRRRQTDSGGRPVDTRAVLRDGSQFADIGGLRDYLLTSRREDILRQFARKLLGYALGRSVRLGDRPLIKSMVQQLGEAEGRFSTAIEAIVRSRQFREH